MYPNGNDDCIWCGTNDYPDVRVTQEQDYYQYRCGKCDELIAQCIRVTGRSANVPDHAMPPYVANDVMWRRDSTDIHTWEVWWDDYSTAAFIHGYPIIGNRDFLSIVHKLSTNDP